MCFSCRVAKREVLQKKRQENGKGGYVTVQSSVVRIIANDLRENQQRNETTTLPMSPRKRTHSVPGRVAKILRVARENFNYKRNIIEDKRDNKNILPKRR